jgi:hypothetical protein
VFAGRRLAIGLAEALESISFLLFSFARNIATWRMSSRFLSCVSSSWAFISTICTRVSSIVSLLSLCTVSFAAHNALTCATGRRFIQISDPTNLRRASERSCSTACFRLTKLARSSSSPVRFVIFSCLPLRGKATKRKGETSASTFSYTRICFEEHCWR